MEATAMVLKIMETTTSSLEREEDGLSGETIWRAIAEGSEGSWIAEQLFEKLHCRDVFIPVVIPGSTETLCLSSPPEITKSIVTPREYEVTMALADSLVLSVSLESDVFLEVLATHLARDLTCRTVEQVIPVVEKRFPLMWGELLCEQWLDGRTAFVADVQGKVHGWTSSPYVLRDLVTKESTGQVIFAGPKSIYAVLRSCFRFRVARDEKMRATILMMWFDLGGGIGDQERVSVVELDS